MKSVASSCAPLAKVFDHVSLLTEREGAAIVLSQHLQQSGESWGSPGVRLRVQSNTSEASPVKEDTTRGMRYESS